MNILITSAGTRGYLIRYFKKALKEKGKIFAADCSKYAPALYNADNYFIHLKKPPSLKVVMDLKKSTAFDY